MFFLKTAFFFLIQTKGFDGKSTHWYNKKVIIMTKIHFIRDRILVGIGGYCIGQMV